MPLPLLAPLKVVLFDVYGTLFDVYSLSEKTERVFPGRGVEVSRLWRQKQLEYTWLRSLMGNYTDFDQITEDALRYTMASLQITPSSIEDPATPEGGAENEPGDEEDYPLYDGDEAINWLLKSYLELPLFPEVRSTLEELGMSHRLGILSNGTPTSLQHLIEHHHLEQQFSLILSVDSLQVYKPDWRVYRMAWQHCGAPRSQIGFVSSNSWDAIAAAHYGFTVFWINRQKQSLDLHGPAPRYILTSLEQLLPIVKFPL